MCVWHLHQGDALAPQRRAGSTGWDGGLQELDRIILDVLPSNGNIQASDRIIGFNEAPYRYRIAESGMKTTALQSIGYEKFLLLLT